MKEFETTYDTFIESVDRDLATALIEHPLPELSPSATRRRLNAYRTVYKDSMRVVERMYDEKQSGIATARFITGLVDRFVIHAWNLHVASDDTAPGLAVIALGGYGRRELCPFSDIDILFLVDDEITGLYDPAISDMLQFLWDMNLDLGHSTRTTEECIEASKTDPQFATSLLDSRIVTGDGNMWDAHRDTCGVSRDERERKLLVTEKIEERTRRLTSFQNTTQIQEPNVKECPGALRDIHVARWLMKLMGHGGDIRGYNLPGYLTSREAKGFGDDLDFFLSLRHALHFLNGRRADLLDHVILPDAAVKTGYKGEGIVPVERLMHDYYMHAGRVRRLTDRIVTKVLEEMNGERRKGLRRTVDGIIIGENDVSLPSEAAESLERKPHLIMALFGAAAGNNLPVAGDTASAVETALEANDINFCEHQEVRAEFHRLIDRRRGVGATLRLMHEYGVLTKIIPEFDEISWHYQYDYYHTYTTDEHSIRVVENLERMATGSERSLPELHEIMQDVTARGALYLAGILHDIGKRTGRGHAHQGEIMAARALRRLRYDRRTIELVRFLIREHLLMSHISQRRDTDDEETIADFIGRVGSEGRLRMLTLLTFADLLALSEGALTEWKKTLLRGLFKKSLMLIEKGYEEHGAARKRDIETIVHALAGEVPPIKVIRHLNLLPDQYMRVTGKSAIRSHLKGVGLMEKRGVWSSFRHGGDITLLTVITRDYPHALSDICGTITASDINIVGARIFTREDGIIIDTFLVTNPGGGNIISPDTQRLFKDNITSVISHETGVRELIESHHRRWRRRKRNVVFSPPRVRVHNDVSSNYTILDVFAIDYAGLLYDITSVLASLDIDIHTARIGTDEDQVADAFYIQNADGGKIEDDAAIETLKSEIIGRLEEAYG